MARAARTIPPAEAITTKAVLPGLPETDTLPPSESSADVATSMTPTAVALLVGEVELTPDTSATGAADGAELTGAVVGLTGTLMNIDMDIDILIDIEKKRRPSSSARARKSLINIHKR
jgi:hypothetical protein